MTRALAALLVASLAACSGSEGGSKGSETPAAETKSPEQQKQEESERKLRAAQESAIEAMCDRLFDCAVEDTRKNKPKELEGANLEEMRGKYMAECEEEYGRSQLSPRQVKVIQKCVNEAPTCGELETCLQDANKQG
jgi:predicted small lipoprotein YifL